MKLSELPKLKTKNKRRVGQGISAGQGKTAGRGTKGQNSRTGRKIRPGFEGGQMPLAQRIPKKRGFVARAKKPVTITLGRLEVLKDGSKVTTQVLRENGMIKVGATAKIVAGGSLTKKLIVTLPVTKSAGEAILKAGGNLEK